MQTFLPYADFSKSAYCLDVKRLGKQRVETMQILNALLGLKNEMKHPAAYMWRGYELQLCNYGIAMCDEWIKRGYSDTLRNKFIDIKMKLFLENYSYPFPPWFNNSPIHLNHRARLLQKNYEWYKQFQWQVEPVDVNYWPIEIKTVNGVKKVITNFK